jgi:hypothetical protein
MHTSSPLHRVETPFTLALPLFLRRCLFFAFIPLVRANERRSGTLAKARLAHCWLFVSLIALGLPTVAQSQTQNTAYGQGALSDPSLSGTNNTAIGYVVLSANSTGSSNTGVGAHVLEVNGTGSQNTAIGTSALEESVGSYNTATGFEALGSGSGEGSGNVANGWQALFSNSSRQFNTASGVSALHVNTSGNQNTATGVNALYHSNGANNTADGAFALENNTSGATNVALGYQAGKNLTTGSNNIDIGAGLLGKAGEANTTRIGKTTQAATYIAGISGKTVASASAVAVFVDSTGKLGTVKSSARYKDNIKPMDKASEALLQLKPVTFHYKQELDPDGVTQFGLIAEQVEKVNPDLIVRDEESKVETVRYEAINAMLLNEFLKEHKKVQELQTTVAKQQALAAAQQKQIQVLTAGLQKVANSVELEKSASRVTANR